MVRFHCLWKPQCPNAMLRRRLWQDLSADILNIRGPWISIGDYNSVISEDEVSSNGELAMHRSAGFTEWLFNQNLTDMGFGGSKYTWVIGLTNTTFRGARLDRGVCNLEWRELFPEARIIPLPIVQSDHAPLLVNLNENIDLRSNRFRFQTAWLTHRDFPSVIKKEWDSKITLSKNIANMATVLSEWNVSTFGNIHTRKRKLLAWIAGIQRCMNKQPAHGLIKLDRKLRKELDNVLEQEELLWYQKSREERILLGDRNTEFYHASTIVKRSKSRIEALKIDNGEWIMEAVILKQMVQGYFTSLFQSDFQCDPNSMQRGLFPRLAASKLQELQGPFSMKEIKQALFDIAPFKATGPDGLHAGFFQKMFPVAGEAICKFALDFFASGIIPEGTNHTVLTPIPKTRNPESVTQFRPISLCNVSYKILTKAMTSRLKKVMAELIGTFQSSFVPGRQISDNILAYQEVLHSMRKQKGLKGYMAIKIDLEKLMTEFLGSSSKIL